MKKIFLFGLFILPGIFSIAQPASTVSTEAEQMPYFPGCDHHKSDLEKRKCSNNSLVAFISNNLSYPETARSKNIQGTVYVSFVVDQNGQASQPKILRGIGEACDNEALNVVREMPRWEPAYDQGKPVSVQLNLPIQFYLSDTKSDKAATYQINWGSLTGPQITPALLEENLNKKLIVRDQNGDELHFSELIFTFEKKATYLEASSNGSINTKMRKLIKKVRSGGVFQITVVIQKKGELIEVVKNFEVIKT